MNLTRLTHFPDFSFPKDAATGDTILDRYLKKVDEGLLGAARTRLPLLLELRNDLEEHKEHFVSTGLGEIEGAEAAICRLGEPSLHTGPQHSRILRRLAQVSVWVTAIMVAWGLAFDLPDGLGVIDSIVTRWEYHLAGVVSLTWFTVFVYPMKALPTRLAQQEQFVVAYPRSWIVLAYPLAGMSFVMTTACVLTIVGVELPISWWGFTASNSVLIAPLTLLCTYFSLWCAARKFEVDPAGLRIRSLLGTTKVPWQAVSVLRSVGERYPWLPLGWYWRDVQRFAYEDQNGTLRNFLLPPDMENYDQLVHIARAKVKLRECGDTGLEPIQ